VVVADTAARLLKLLSLLQRRPSWTGTELAHQLGVDARTVRRDIERVRDLGYQVTSTPGSAGGYRLGVGADMPPLLLDEQEAMAVAVLLGASAGMALPGIERATLATLARIDRLLPPRLQRRVKALRAATVPLLATPEAVPAENLARLAEGCESRELAQFDYSARDGRKTSRRVEPYRLVATERRWYLVAFDLDRTDWRTFRVDRVAKVRLTGHTFTPRKLEDAARLVSEAISAAPYRYQIVVRVEVPVVAVRKAVSPSVATVEDAGDHVVLRIGADELHWVAGYLIGLGFPFEVLHPPELSLWLSTLGNRLVSTYSSGPPLRAGSGPDAIRGTGS
jgi:predicted DNA-binding transcriptional regulator YafY